MKGMVWVTLFLFTGKLMGAAKEMAIAYRYGISAEVDAYFFIFNFVSWPIGVWFSALTVVLVPLVAKSRHDSRAELIRFRTELFGTALVLGIVMAVLLLLGLPEVLQSHRIGLPAATAEIALRALPGFVMLVPLGVLISLLSAWMLAAGRHRNTLLESVPAFVVGVAVLAFPNSKGIDSLVWATVVGFTAHLISLVVPLRHRKEIELPRFTFQAKQWDFFWKGFGIMLFGQALMSLVTIVDQFFAVKVGVGGFATLGYANRILGLLLTLGGTVVSRATLPVFSKIQLSSNSQLHRVVAKWAAIMFLVGSGSAFFSWWFAPFAVKFLFERGAFTAQDSAAVAEILRYALVQLPFYFASLVLVSGLLSRGMHRYVAISAMLNFVIKIGGNFLLVPTMGLRGIVVSTALMYAVSFVVLCIVARFIAHKEGEKSCAC
jgi:putative peptidoglycan lipid II flippase